jgi:hypothetical protein
MMADKSLESRLKQIEAEIAKGAKIGRLDVRPKTASEIEATIRRVLAGKPNELLLAMVELKAARVVSAKARAGMQAAMAGGRVPNSAFARQFIRWGGTKAVTPVGLEKPGGGVQIMLDKVFRLLHTRLTKDGKECWTDRWINDAFLVYDPRLEPLSRGGVDNPWLGVRGPKFRCYYPASGMADWELLQTTQSSGRWLNAWSQKSNYVRF